MEMCLDVNSDMISNLPVNVTDQILVRLPITDAVRTSVLSTKWRYKWTTIPELVFHDDLVIPPPYDNKAKLIHFIDRVLLLHTGFILKFELSTKCWNCSTIDCWILFLLRKNIKELVLKFWGEYIERYKLPSCFFSAQQICTLELRGCVLKPPPATFTGFSNLKSLYLNEITFVDKGVFECLISKCPLLERLTYIQFFGLDNLNIWSPNLKYLCLWGCFQHICFENTPLLSDVSVNSHHIIEEKFKEVLPSETGNVVKVLSSLPKLRKFEAGFFFLQFLTVGKIPEKLPFTCHHLTNLSLSLDFEFVNHICVTFCFLNSCPNLRQLEIIGFKLDLESRWIPNYEDHKFSGHNIESFWKGRTLVDWKMSGLQIVKITNFQGFELELKFIKLLLANSPMLEVLSIRSSKQDILNPKGLKFLKELLVFPRTSPKAKIKFLLEKDEE